MCHPDEKRAAVLAQLLAGQSVSEIAKEYQVPAGTIRRWKFEASKEGIKPTERTTNQREKIGELVVDYLGEIFVTLKAQQQTFRDPKWLDKQPASELAVLHGVLCDKGIRILEALSGQDTASEAE